MKRKILFVSAAVLKIIAMVIMVIDHVSVMFYQYLSEYYDLMRIIGRISFPIFAYLITDGMIHSKNKIKYILQMLIIGFVIQIVEVYILHMSDGEIMSTLGFSALIIYFLQKPSWKLKLLAVVPFVIIILGDFDLKLTPFYFQYGIYGSIVIVGFYLCYLLSYKLIDWFNLNKDMEKHEFVKTNKFMLIRNGISSIFFIIINILYGLLRQKIQFGIKYQVFSIIAVLFILLYNGTRGYNKPWFKWFCYIFYPLQFILIYVAYIIFMVNI